MSKRPAVNDFPDSGLSTEEARQRARSERTVFKPPSQIEHLPMVGERIKVWFPGHGWKLGTVEYTWANLDVQVRYANGFWFVDKLAYPWRLHKPKKRCRSDDVAAADVADAGSLMGDMADDARRTSQRRFKVDNHSLTIYGKEVVGRRVSMLWPDGRWYDAKIVSFEHRASGDKVHTLHYDDKDRREVQFHTLLPAKWRFVDNPAPPRSRGVARRCARPQAETLAGANALVGLAASAAASAVASAPAAAAEAVASAAAGDMASGAGAPTVRSVVVSALAAAEAAAPAAAAEVVASAPSAAGDGASAAGALTAPLGVSLERDHGGASFSSSATTVAASVAPPSMPTHAAYLQFLARNLDAEIGTLPNLAQQVAKAMALLEISPGMNFVENIAKLKEQFPFEEP